MKSVAVLWVAVLFALASGVASAQPAKASLVVTAADPSGAVIPNATVRMVGLEDATKAAAVPPVKTTDKGIATIQGPPPGGMRFTASSPDSISG